MTGTSRSLTSRGPRRRVCLLLAGAALLAVPVLAGCEAGGNSDSSDFHPVGFGGYTTSADGITINNAFVLGPDPSAVLPQGSQAGLFLSIFSTSGDRLESASAPGTASSVTIGGSSVSVPGGGTANLNGPSPQLVLTGLTRPLAGGQTVLIALTFATAGAVTLQVPVQPHAYEYASFQPPAALPPSPAATASSSASTTATVHKKKRPAHAKATASATPSPTP